jgi:hypothetical protein
MTDVSGRCGEKYKREQHRLKRKVAIAAAAAAEAVDL